MSDMMISMLAMLAGELVLLLLVLLSIAWFRGRASRRRVRVLRRLGVLEQIAPARIVYHATPLEKGKLDHGRRGGRVCAVVLDQGI